MPEPRDVSTLSAYAYQEASSLVPAMRVMGRTMEDLDWAAHEAIMRQVYFRDGLRSQPLSSLLESAGFSNIQTGSIGAIRRAQRKAAGFPRALTVGVYDDFWLTASKI